MTLFWKTGKAAGKLFLAATVLMATVVFGGNQACAAGVTINETNFPDANFRTYVSVFDTDHNGVLSDAERKAVDAIVCNGTETVSGGITSLKGVEFFTSITSLECEYNQIRELDVTRNKQLKTLDFYGNNVEYVDLSKNAKLEALICGRNQIGRLDIQNNPSLKILECTENPLDALDIRNNAALKRVIATEPIYNPFSDGNDVVAYLGQEIVEGLPIIYGMLIADKTDTFVTEIYYQDMYRLYNPYSGEHFYTANAGEKDTLISAGWNYEGIAWKAPNYSNTPVYRLYNPYAGDHHYTPSVEERNVMIAAGWILEGIGWYSDDAMQVPLYRLFNPNAWTGMHHYTTSTEERANLIRAGWKDEGIGWHGAK